MFKKISIILMIVCFLLGMATRAETENMVKGTTTTELEKVATNGENKGTENYVKKVIIDAEWGDDIGEFGTDFRCVGGPGPLAVDRSENIYVYDIGHLSLKQFNKNGRFIKDVIRGKIILNMDIRNDTVYAIGFNDCNDSQKKLFLINIDNGELLFSNSVEIPNSLEDSYPQVQLKVESDKGVILRKGMQQYSLNIHKEVAEFRKFRKEILALSDSALRKVDNLVKNIGGAGECYLKTDDNGSFYFGAFKIYKVNTSGDIEFQLKLPRKGYIEGYEYIGEYTVGNTYITDKGDIYYLYPTGKIVQEDWELKFVPGKVQVIKWELKG